MNAVVLAALVQLTAFHAAAAAVVRRDVEDPPHLWRVPLADATSACGNGCATISMSEISSKVPIQELTVASVFFYETPADQPPAEQETGEYEIFTLNHHRRRHHNVTRFSLSAEEPAQGGWRSSDVLQKIKSWHRHHSSDDAEYNIVMRKIGDTDPLNGRFAVNDAAKPFVLIGVPSSSIYARPGDGGASSRRRRSLGTVTRRCEGRPDEACCLTVRNIDVNTLPRTHAWWVSPRNFPMKMCTGKCELTQSQRYYYTILNIYGEAIQRHCQPQDFESFDIRYHVSGSTTLLDGRLDSFMPTSCRCS